MADESILDQALALIPGVGTKRRPKTAPSPKRQLSLVQKNLAKLTKDIQKLAAMVSGKPTTATRGRQLAKRKISKASKRRTPTSKRKARSGK